MHALQRLLRDGLARRGWNQSDLARESGLSKQVVSKLLREDRAPVARLLRTTTVDGLAHALQVDTGVVRAAIAEEMGLPGSEVQVVYDARGVGDDDLIRELARRLATASASASASASVSAAAAAAAGPDGPLSLVRTAAGAEGGQEEVRLAPVSTSVPVAWAARTGEPDQAPHPHEDAAVEPSTGVQVDDEGPEPA